MKVMSLFEYNPTLTNSISEISLEYEKIKINIVVDHFAVILVNISYLIGAGQQMTSFNT